MRELVGQHRLLRVGRKPIEQIHLLGLNVVVAGDLLLKKINEEFVKIEVARQQSKFLEDDLGSLETLCIFVLIHLLVDVLGYLLATRELARDLLLNREAGVFAQPGECVVDGSKQLLSLLRRDLLFRWRCRRLDLYTNVALAGIR